MKKLDVDILRHDVQKLFDWWCVENGKPTGWGAWTDIGETAGTSNVSRIINDPDKDVEINTWLKLHAAYPDIISPPTYTDGSPVTYKKTVQNHNVNTISGVTAENGNVEQAQHGPLVTENGTKLDPLLVRFAKLAKKTMSELEIELKIEEMEARINALRESQKKIMRAELAV